MLLDDIGTNYSLWLWVPAFAGTTNGEWRSRQPAWGDDARGSAFSRRECVRVVQDVSAREGRGECRVPTHPQPRMQS